MAAKRRQRGGVNKVFTARLTKLLKERDWDTFDLSRHAVVRDSTIRGWYTICAPSLEHLANVAKALNVSMDYLWGLTNHRTTTPDAKRQTLDAGPEATP